MDPEPRRRLLLQGSERLGHACLVLVRQLAGAPTCAHRMEIKPMRARGGHRVSHFSKLGNPGPGGQRAYADVQPAVLALQAVAQELDPFEQAALLSRQLLLPIIKRDPDRRGMLRERIRNAFMVEVGAVGDDRDLFNALLAGQFQGLREDRGQRGLAAADQHAPGLALEQAEQPVEKREVQVLGVRPERAGTFVAAAGTARGDVQLDGSGEDRFLAQEGAQFVAVKRDLLGRGHVRHALDPFKVRSLD